VRTPGAGIQVRVASRRASGRRPARAPAQRCARRRSALSRRASRTRPGCSPEAAPGTRCAPEPRGRLHQGQRAAVPAFGARLTRLPHRQVDVERQLQAEREAREHDRLAAEHLHTGACACSAGRLTGAEAACADDLAGVHTVVRYQLGSPPSARAAQPPPSVRMRWQPILHERGVQGQSGGDKETHNSTCRSQHMRAPQHTRAAEARTEHVGRRPT